MFSRGILLMFGSVFFFALMNVSVKFLARLPGEEITLMRCVAALLASGFLARRSGASLLGTERGILLLRGLFGGSSMLAYFYALLLLPLASAVTIQYLSPIITTFFAARFLGERLSPWSWLLLGVSFSGVALVKGFDPRVNMVGLGAGLISAVASSGAYVNISRLKGKESPYTIILYLSAVGTFISLATLLLRGSFIMPTPEEWGWLLAVSVLAQIAQDFMTRAYLSERASDVAYINYTGLVFALLFGWLFFHETHSWQAVGGMSLVLAGVVINILLHQKDRVKKMEKAA
jgi:drug/metabolite transporter (DMT)-like permease